MFLDYLGIVLRTGMVVGSSPIWYAPKYPLAVLIQAR